MKVLGIESSSLTASVALVTDDVMADQLEQGHLNLLVKLAYDLGMPIEKAIYIKC